MSKAMKHKEFDIEQKYLNYLNEIRPELIEAEAKVEAIKKGKMWKKTYEYFNVLHHRGHIKTMPTKKNGYKLELWDNVVSLNELASILTPEQMEQVQKLQSQRGK